MSEVRLAGASSRRLAVSALTVAPLLAGLAALLASPARAQGQTSPPGAPPAPAAQASTAPSPGSADQGSGLQEVVVTARFRTENLQTTPIAITAVTSADIEAHGFQDVTQIANVAPNVNLEPAGSGFGKLAFVSIRGVGQSDFKYTFEPGVGFYIDDVYFGTAFGSIFDLLDISSVEILRGPQGTLFGKNTEGGAVRVFTTKPKGDNSGYVEAGYGSYNRERFRGALDVALVPDRLFARIAVGSNRSDGYMDVYDFACANPGLAGSLKPVTYLNHCKIGTYGGDDVRVGRVALRWLPTDGLEANLSADLTDDHGEAPASKLLAINLPPNPCPGASATNPNPRPCAPQTQVASAVALFNSRIAMPLYGVALDSRFITPSPYTTYATYTDPIAGVSFPNESTLYSWGVAGTVDWDTPLSGVHVKSISAYRRYRGAFAQDTSGAPITGNLPINYLDHHQFSEELQVSGKLLENALDWTVGGYYFDSSDYDTGIVDQPSNFIAGRLPGILFLTADPAGSKDESVFAHVNYQISSRWGLELGGRYSHETKSYTFYRYLPNLVGLVPSIPGTAPGTTQPLFPLNTGGFLAGFAPPPTVSIPPISRFDPKVSLSYELAPDVMAYVQYSTGFKSGGFNPRPLNRAQVTSFGPEILKAYEVGLKSEWFDHRLRANVAAFWSDYSDLQLPVATTDATGTPAFLTESVGSARIQGAELELAARPVGGLRIEGSLGYLNFHYLNLGGAAYDGNPLTSAGTPNPLYNPSGPTLSDVPPLTPRWKGSAGIEYAISLGAAGTLTPRADFTYQSRVYNDPQDEPISAQGGYGILDARLTWESARGGWQASLYAFNLADKLYYVTIFNGLSTYDSVNGQPGQPRTLLFTVRKSF
jgi:iron complex outermembrane recepter protein